MLYKLWSSIVAGNEMGSGMDEKIFQTRITRMFGIKYPIVVETIFLLSEECPIYQADELRKKLSGI